MTNIKAKIVASAATAVLLATSFAPAAFADTTVRFRNTGANSTNRATINKTNRTRVQQTNRTAVVNLTGVFQNTGGNTANSNTGNGTVSVDSGNATSHVTNTTTTVGNDATVDPCGCPNGDTTVRFRNTGADSTNTVNITETNSTNVNQTNGTLVVNGTLVAQDTGGNHANSNTGDGGVSVNSGNAASTVTNTTTTGGNTLNP